MDTIEFTAGLARDGYGSVESKSAPPGVLSAPHAHPCDIRALLTGGALTLSCGGTSRRYQAGDIVEIPAGAEHIEHNGPDGYTYIVGRRDVPH